jgi:hypothetical protein
MKRTLLAGAATLAVMLSGQAFAQSVAVEIDPAHQATIENYIVSKKVPPAPVKDSISIGSTLPADIEIRSVPASWGPSVAKFSYAYAGNRVYFVWPSARKVARVLESNTMVASPSRQPPSTTGMGSTAGER